MTESVRNNGPDCYCDAESILNAVSLNAVKKRDEYALTLEEKKQRARDAELITGFFERVDLDPEADYHSSLILLKSDKFWRVNGHLNPTPGLDNLPQIERPGDSSPVMSGHLLGFDDDAVTDPYLQRAHCLSFCRDAAYQEWTGLLLRILKSLPPTDEIDGALQHADMRAKFLLLRRVANLGRDLLYGSPHTPESAEKAADQLATAAFELFVLTAKPTPREKVDYLREELRKTLLSAPLTTSTEEGLCLKLCSTLLLSLRKRIFDHRHLGDARRTALYDVNGRNYVIQGAGDLSMNAWNVAVYSRNSRNGTSPRKKELAVVIPFQEPSASRNYHCLLFWKHPAKREALKKAEDLIGQDGAGITIDSDLAIAEVRVSKVRPKLRLANQRGVSLDHLVDFAVYGKLVLRNGEPVRRSDVVEEFQDLRHVFDLPNLNPMDEDMVALLGTFVCPLPPSRGKDAQADGRQSYHAEFLEWLARAFADPGWQAPTELADDAVGFLLRHPVLLRTMLRRPRQLFYRFPNADVYLLESALREVSNLKELACTSAVTVSWSSLGAPQDWVEFRLLASGYHNRGRRAAVDAPGDFAWEEAEKGKPRLHIHLKDARYPCTMIGVGSPDLNSPDNGASQEEKKPDTLYLLAWGHDFRYARYSVWECAEVLRAAGAKYALLVDEGQDVFQCHVPTSGDLGGSFATAEEGCESLDGFMKVPFSHKGALLRRTGMRASLSFWQSNRK